MSAAGGIPVLRTASPANRLRVVISAERVHTPLAVARLEATARSVLRAERVRDALVSIALVSRARITALNAAHLKRRGATDVIAFGFSRDPRGPVVGDIYLAPDIARANARRFRVPVREEVLRLVIHGVLHVLGYDHPEGPARETSHMWRRQEALLARVLRSRAA